MAGNQTNNTYYWAAEPIESIAQEIKSTFDNYLDYIYTTGYLDKIRASYQRFYNIDQDGAYRASKSQDGSVTRVTVNHFKNLVKRLHILITQSKINFVPRARNSDTKSQIEADLAKGILEYYADEKGMDRVFAASVETALVCLEAFVHTSWNLNKGYELTADENGKVIHTGDQDFEVYTALDVARNLQQADSDFYIIRARRNKWDLAALHPEFKDAILSDSAYQDTMDQYRLRPIEARYDSDLVDVYYLYHRDTPALPDGRFTVVCNNQVLADGKLGYKRPPVYRLSAGDVIDTIQGDSPSVDLLSIQEVINALTSAVVTNNLNFAMQNVWSSDSNTSIKALSRGQNLVVSAVKPEALQLTQSSGETYKLIESLVQQQQLLSGINDTARGNPESNLKSGNSLALMLAQAIQFVSDLQKNYAQLASDVGTAVINNMQKFAKGDMLVVIGGQSRKSYIKPFKSQDIINVDRVSVDMGNPLAQTVAGRYELVQQWMQYGLVQSPAQIAEFMKSGQIDSLLEDQFKDQMLVREENQNLKEGKPVVALMTDDHPYHVQEHRKLLSDPDSRMDPNMVNSVLAHIQEHINLRLSMPPDMAALFGQQPLPSQQAPQGQPAPGPQGPPPEQQQGPMPPEANLPNVPPGTPPEAAADYAQATNQQPQDVMPQG